MMLCGHRTFRNTSCKSLATECKYHGKDYQLSEFAKWKQKNVCRFRHQHTCGAPLSGHGRKFDTFETCKNTTKNVDQTCVWHRTSNLSPQLQRKLIQQCYQTRHRPRKQSHPCRSLSVTRNPEWFI